MPDNPDDPKTGTTGLDGWEARLRAAAMAVEASRQAYDDNRELRDRLVVEGFDAGHPVGAVAKAALISQPRVHQLIARHG